MLNKCHLLLIKIDAFSTQVCLNLLSDCDNLEGVGDDEDSLSEGTPGKRSTRTCLNTMSDDCVNGGLVGSGDDEESLLEGTPGKRGKLSRTCLNTMSDDCANGGLVGAGDDEESLLDGTPGKRAADLELLRYLEASRYCRNDARCVYLYLKTGKRDARDFFRFLGGYLQG